MKERGNVGGGRGGGRRFAIQQESKKRKKRQEVNQWTQRSKVTDMSVRAGEVRQRAGTLTARRTGEPPHSEQTIMRGEVADGRASAANSQQRSR